MEVRRDDGKFFKLFPEQSTIVWLQVHKLGQLPIDLSSPETLGKNASLYPNMATMNMKGPFQMLGHLSFRFDVGLPMFNACLLQRCASLESKFCFKGRNTTKESYLLTVSDIEWWTSSVVSRFCLFVIPLTEIDKTKAAIWKQLLCIVDQDRYLPPSFHNP